MDTFTCSHVKGVVNILMREQELKGKLFVAGGIVPWLLSGHDSERRHSDVDIVVRYEDMDFIRRRHARYKRD